mmetsp:Transcript_25476/g.39107  ORF Transcript_25476/g.39107 Transcript_25476/m.39107 type:complete len:106 (-) Transcript_25476:1481-1798(-)
MYLNILSAKLFFKDILRDLDSATLSCVTSIVLRSTNLGQITANGARGSYQVAGPYLLCLVTPNFDDLSDCKVNLLPFNSSSKRCQKSTWDLHMVLCKEWNWILQP